jgi:uncharacterized membrane protein
MKLVVTKAKTLNAFTWIRQGWRLFTLQPGPFMAMSAILIAISLLGNLHAILGIVIIFMMPFLSAGFYQCASRAEQGETITAADVFAYFSQIQAHKVFIRLAFVSIVLSIPMTQFAVSFAAELQLMASGEGTIDLVNASLMVALIWLNFMLLAFAIPAAWIAPETGVLTLLKQSFQACWINVMPLTVYGLIIFALIVISMPIILVGWLIMYSVSVLSFYQMFLSIYQPETPIKKKKIITNDAGEIIRDDETEVSSEQDTDNEQVSKNNTPDN